MFKLIKLCTSLLTCLTQVADHSVSRVISFFSSRRNWDSPTPHPPPASVPPPHRVPGRRGTLACERGGGRVPVPTMGHTLWYSINICTLCGRGIWRIQKMNGKTEMNVVFTVKNPQLPRSLKTASRVCCSGRLGISSFALSRWEDYCKLWAL